MDPAGTELLVMRLLLLKERTLLHQMCNLDDFLVEKERCLSSQEVQYYSLGAESGQRRDPSTVS